MLNRLSVGTKLGAAFALVLTLMLGVGIFSILQLGRVAAGNAVVADRERDFARAQIALAQLHGPLIERNRHCLGGAPATLGSRGRRVGRRGRGCGRGCRAAVARGQGEGHDSHHCQCRRQAGESRA